ncbi:Predicted amidohydrolase [Mesobacillus persicus]|uniref:Predicted amidohydrolase n=1 Tax=Mesobacillus persicus TaxID=930146 RepID=A0A1H8EQQ9_9BACI|nr:carbon-nitrogen family hydrolase [Mesobacillus persicus]SEN21217.1 Predicted amidohydrolase [Mesobacillus persicus]
MKLAIVQMDIGFGETEKNYQAVENYIEQAVKSDVDVIVFPEMWNTGYALNRLSELADDNGFKTKEILSRLAKKHNVNIVGGSVATKKEDRFYNTMYVANRTGNIIAEYDKAHLFKLMDEHLYMEQGKRDNVFELDGTTCGGVICYDLRFPEWIRAHTLAGAKVIFVPAEWPKKRIDHWQLLLQARAIENQCFVVAVNRVGADPNNEFNGHSMVVAPWGEVLINNQTDEGIYYLEVDLQEVEHVRKRIPVYQDRRTDLYN